MLKILRRKRKLTQSELAQRVQVSQAYIARLELGQKRNPTLPVLQRLAKALGVTSGAVIEALAGRTTGGRP
jgi:transcriptional regulator with XRE-family HTH domain